MLPKCKTPAHVCSVSQSQLHCRRKQSREKEEDEGEDDLTRIRADDDVEVGGVLELLAASDAEVARLDAVLAVMQDVQGHISNVVRANAELKVILRDNLAAR